MNGNAFSRPVAGVCANSAPSIAGAGRKVSMPGVYKKIAEYTGDLAFPLPIGGNDSDCTVSTSSTKEPPHTPSKSAASLMSPTKTVFTRAVATTTTGQEPALADPHQLVLGSPLKSGAKRVAVYVPPPSPGPSRMACTTPSRRRAVNSATPAYSNATVSDATKKVILDLLRPVSSARITAQELCISAWLNSQE